MKTALNILFVILLFLPLLGWSQSAHFERLTKKEGFPRGHISKIIKDKQGFLWVGTTDGLFRYDGKTSVEFRHNPKDTNSLSNNSILSLFEDSKGNIWVGTRQGLSMYSVENESFKRIDSENYIHSILEDRKGFLWYGTYYGLYRLNVETGDLLNFQPQIENPNSLTHEVIWEIFEDSGGRLWFGTANGLTLYDNDDSFRFLPISPEPENPNGLKTGRIWSFVQQKNGTVWLGANNGFYRVHEVGNDLKFQHFGHNPDDENSLSHPFIEDMILDKNEHLWVGTWQGGLNEVVLPKTENDSIKFIRYRHNSNDENSISSNLVEAIFSDDSGVIWVGTSAGMDKISPSTRKFKLIEHLPNTPGSLSENIIKSILRDSDGDLWVGTRNGLNFLSKEDFEKGNFDFTIFKKDPKNSASVSHNNVFGLDEDSNKILWISTYNGLNFIDLSKNKEKPAFRTFFNNEGLPHSFIFSVSEIEKGKYWVPTYGQLSKMTFDPNSHELTRFQNFDMDETRDDALVNATVYRAVKDRFGQFWFATFNGIGKYIEKDGREYFENYLNIPGDSTSLSNNSIMTLFKDSKGRLWAATRSGLNLIVQTSSEDPVSFRNFGMNEGFPNDVIQAIEEDENGHFWVGTNRGLVHFDPEAAIQNQSSVLRVYTIEDGLASEGIVFRSSFRDSDGNLFFGTADGLNYFKLSDLISNKSVPKVVFTDLKILNKSVKPSDEKNAVLKKSIGFTDNLTFNYRQNVWTLEFVALDFAKPEKNQYSYKLEGYNEDWIENRNANSATYMNIPSGEYIFKVKASNNDGIWNENPTEMRIEILPPPWLTWWAYCLYGLGILGLIYVYIRHRIQLKIKELEKKIAVERARFEERETLRKKNAADFHDELGHRLTKISLFLALAERELENGTPLRQYLTKIKQHTKGLSGGIRDLIWTLDPKKDSLYETLIRLQEFGDKLFDFSEIQFKSKGVSEEFESVKLEPDERKHLLLIFKEAMNNCLKYSEAENAELAVLKSKKTIQIIFRDDGNGFDMNEISKGYGLKNMQSRAEKTGNELQILSRVGKGTEISLIMKKSKIPHLG